MKEHSYALQTPRHVLVCKEGRKTYVCYLNYCCYFEANGQNQSRVNQTVILAGKRGSRRQNRSHSTKSFRENVVVAESSYKMLEVLSFCDCERV